MRVGRSRAVAHRIVRSPGGARVPRPGMANGTWGMVTTGDGGRNRHASNRRLLLRAEATPPGDTP